MPQSLLGLPLAFLYPTFQQNPIQIPAPHHTLYHEVTNEDTRQDFLGMQLVVTVLPVCPTCAFSQM